MVWKYELARIQSMRRPPRLPVKKCTVPSSRVATGCAARKTSCSEDAVVGCGASSVR
jgi:hypothetical protein